MAKILATFFIIVLLHFLANALGFYTAKIVWFDNVLHVFAGIGFGLSWLWLVQKNNPNAVYFISLIVFVLGTAIVWELLEFLFFQWFTSYAYRFSIYSSSVNEASIDVASNLIGGIALILLIKFKLRSKLQ